MEGGGRNFIMNTRNLSSFLKKGTIATSYEGQPLKKFHLFPGIAAKILWQRSFVFVFYVSSLQLNFVV